MPGLYNAAIYCDDCIVKIKDSITFQLWHSGVGTDCPDGTDNVYRRSIEELFDYLDSMDESAYDSSEYPKYVSDDAESDCPQHCGDCGDFLENPITSYGNDYVTEAVNRDLLDGVTDSVAITEWMPHYDDLDYVEQCEDCGDYSEDLEDDLCPDCLEKYDDENG